MTDQIYNCINDCAMAVLYSIVKPLRGKQSERIDQWEC